MNLKRFFKRIKAVEEIKEAIPSTPEFDVSYNDLIKKFTDAVRQEKGLDESTDIMKLNPSITVNSSKVVNAYADLDRFLKEVAANLIAQGD